MPNAMAVGDATANAWRRGGVALSVATVVIGVSLIPAAALAPDLGASPSVAPTPSPGTSAIAGSQLAQRRVRLAGSYAARQEG